MNHVSEAVRVDLLGRDRRQSRRALAVAVVLFLTVGALLSVVRVTGWVPGAFGVVTPTAVAVTLGVLLVGCVAAGVNGSQEGGLVQSWLLVLAPVAAWLGLYHYDPADPLSTLAVVAGVAMLAVPPAGTVAHAFGRAIRIRATGDAWADSAGPVLGLLVSSTPERAGLWILLAAALLLAAAGGVVSGLVPTVFLFPVGTIAGAPVLGIGVTLAWLGLTALPGFRAEGLLSSWALLFGPVFGGLVADATTDRFVSHPLLVDAATNALLALALALTVGTLGYLLGTAARRTVRRWQYGQRNQSERTG